MRPVIFLISSLLVCIAQAGATVLTFDKSPQFSNWPNSGKLWNPPASGGYSDYGDRVSGGSQAISDSRGSFTFLYGTAGGPTPFITADYGTSSDDLHGMYAYIAPGEFPAGPAPVLFPYLPGDTSLRRMITLTADPGHYVQLDSFQGMFWSSAGAGHFVTLRVVRINSDNTETVLGSPMTNVLVTGATARTFFPADFGVTELRGPGIAIDMQPDGNQFNSFGFDNIQFSPEPSAAAVLVLAALGIMRGVRRR